MKNMRRIVVVFLAALLVALVPKLVWTQEHKPIGIAISVQDLTTGQPINYGETLHAVDTVQVTVTTNGVNCAGAVAVTAVGVTGAPPEVGVVSRPFYIGAASTEPGESFSLAPFYVGVLPNGTNDWKISASWNGANVGQFDFAKFEFFVNTNAQ